MTGPTTPGAQRPEIATRAELLKRLRERDRPEAHAGLQPPEHWATPVRQNLSQENEFRIKLLRERLQTAHGVLERDNAFARLEGYASASFEKERERF